MPHFWPPFARAFACLAKPAFRALAVLSAGVSAAADAFPALEANFARYLLNAFLPIGLTPFPANPVS
jgi:hypothetical protein